MSDRKRFLTRAGLVLFIAGIALIVTALVVEGQESEVDNTEALFSIVFRQLATLNAAIFWLSVGVAVMAIAFSVFVAVMFVYFRTQIYQLREFRYSPSDEELLEMTGEYIGRYQNGLLEQVEKLSEKGED